MTFEIPGELHLRTGEGLSAETVTPMVPEADSILIIITCMVFLILAGDIFELAPALKYSISRWRGGISMEHSIKTARIRNLIALACLLPASLVANMFDLYSPRFIDRLPANLHTPAIAGVLILTAVLRRLLIPHGRFTREAYMTLLHTAFNHFILFSFSATITALILSAFNVPDTAVRMVLLVETAIIWLLSATHCAQFLASICKGFTTFLYLCGLEMVPAGFLVFSALVL